MVRVCSTHGKEKDLIQGSVGKPEGKRRQRRLSLRCKVNSKIDLREIGWGGID
jgi:hypothetical protein